MRTQVDITTPRDQDVGDQVNMPAPKAPPYRSVLVWRQTLGGLQWQAVNAVAQAATAPKAPNAP